MVDLTFLEHDAIPALALRRPDPATLGPDSEHGRFGRRDVGDDEAARRIETGELDPDRLPHHTPPTVASDQVVGPDRGSVRHRRVDALPVVGHTHDLAITQDRHPELAEHPAGEDALEVALPEPEQVVVTGGEIAERQRDVGEAGGRMDRAFRHEPVDHAALVEDLERAGVQATGAPAVELLGGPTFDDHDLVDACQRQLGRQHQTGRTAPCDDDSLLFPTALFHAAMVSMPRVLDSSPPPRVTLRMSAGS